jgi:hypothetical protein
MPTLIPELSQALLWLAVILVATWVLHGILRDW